MLGLRGLLRTTASALLHADAALGFRVAGRLGAARQGFGSSPRPGDVAAAFGPAPPARLAAVARGIAATEHRHAALDLFLVRRGLAVLAPLVHVSGGERVLALHRERRATVLVLTHVGPVIAALAAYLRLALPVLVVALADRVAAPPPLELCLSAGAGRAYALKRCVERLRSGGIVSVATEGPGEDELPVTVLGKATTIARGAVAMARLGRAAVVPVSTRWRDDGEIDVSFGETLAGIPTAGHAGFEAALARRLAEAITEEIRAAPGQLWLTRLARLASAPPAPGYSSSRFL